MLAGIGIIGITTANNASMVLEPPGGTQPATIDDASATDSTESRLDGIDRKLNEIMRRLSDR